MVKCLTENFDYLIYSLELVHDKNAIHGHILNRKRYRVAQVGTRTMAAPVAKMNLEI